MNCNHYLNEVNEGIYQVQSGFKGTTSLILCPYISNKIEVSDAPNIKILDGASVYWIELRKFAVKKNTDKQEIIIQAAIIGLRSCKYISQGRNILCTLSTPSQSLYDSRNQMLASPLNKKLPLIAINQNQCDFLGGNNNHYKAQPQFYYWVQILYWDVTDRLPTGLICGIFSQAKTAEVETEAILHNLEINQRELFMQRDQPALRHFPVKNHQQFQGTVFTIDPKDCKDMQDALSVRIIDLCAQIYEVGVHIADVSSYMEFVDRQEICRRGCSLYLPHRKISLFPEELTEICSFKAKEQRLSFSVLMRMNGRGQILGTSFHKMIVKNCARINYKQAQQIIEASAEEYDLCAFGRRHAIDLQQSSQIFQSINILNRLSRLRRMIRKNSQILDRNQVFFELDQDNVPIGIGIKQRFESEKLVQECMIAANGEVARKLISSYGPNALIIHHPRPSQYSINNFNSFISDFGIEFDGESILRFETEMKKLFEKEGFKDEFKEALVMRAIQMQEIATYTLYMNSEKQHYGLNMDYYTHFTSPLRRYADVLVHEQLNACLERKQSDEARPSRGFSVHRNLYESIQHLNRVRKRSKKLKQNIVQGFLNLFLHLNKQKIHAKALIMSLGLKSITIYIPLYNLVKEVAWNKPVVHFAKDAIKIKYSEPPEPDCWQIFNKNDSIDVEIESGVHQEVMLKLFATGSSSDSKRQLHPL